MEEERKRIEEEMRKEYEDQLKQKEESLITRLTSEKDNLMEERKKIEDQLQQEMELKLEEKDKNLQVGHFSFKIEGKQGRLDTVPCTGIDLD